MASSTFKVGDKVCVARDNCESRFVRTGARGVVVQLQGHGVFSNNLLIRVDPDDLLRGTGWDDPLTVSVPAHALEKISHGLLDI